ncbi:MAG: hemerythrin domain-containing protein [Gordonia sp. (in: high G+C Gram-positive bacteria)]|uniref:hemerythrin domain-containing protein n=1 Tax=Gordonia sp. (in: high G+C Gram-positive bacteria) TaxID=84139 RepID=UPI003BB56173
MADQISLADALTTEHHEIDAAIDRFAGTGPDESLAAWAQPLVDGLRALRRHIYLEEDLVFPPLKQGALTMPIMVMENEHGELWRRLDALEALLSHDDVDAEPKRSATITACRELLALLAQHNAKEEPVIYPHVDPSLDEAAAAQLAEFMETGTTPDGWTPARADG